MTEPVKYSIVDNCVLTTYGKQPCPHCYDRREFQGRVFWTMPRAVTMALSGIIVAVCATCIAESEVYGDNFYFVGFPDTTPRQELDMVADLGMMSINPEARGAK